MSDRIVVLNKGNVEQIGAPIDLYRKPASPFIAHFIGSSNTLSKSLAQNLLGETADTICVRHEDVVLSQVHSEGIPAEVRHVEFLGPMMRIECAVEEEKISAIQYGGTLPHVGERVYLSIREGAAYLFHGEAS
ncbi:TOBE domain-containing protein [uncultured Cohaesibacter sp.]|uniref:TOBE domain-containing protein n=1 Tax=uncultured Cohaesibacter sp. TaxID=1002546 RepID=UPI00292F46B8|nr:TOBE domain-containing protein [uncultured Cohaesibacter sp.]